jgi:hypothetical protein
VHAAELLDPALTAELAHRGAPFVPAAGSRFALFETVTAYQLNSELACVTTPLLASEAATGEPWEGQTARLAEVLPGLVELLPRSDEAHSPIAREAHIFDWLDARIA